jgi:hypothetical protein
MNKDCRVPVAFVRTKIIMLSLLCVTLFGTASARADSDTFFVRVAEPYIELHTGAGRGYPVFYIAERGEQVEVLKQRTDWIKVRVRKNTLREKEGWVSLEQMAQTLTVDGERLAVAYPDFDAFKQRRWEGGLMLGSFAGADVISIYGAYHFTRNISTEIEASEYFGSFSNGQVGTVSLVHQPFPEWRISPFFTIGTGIIFIDPKSTLVQSKDRSDELFDVGVGVRYYLTRRFLVRAQYRNYVILTDQATNQNAEEWKIGFSAFF